MIYCPIEVHVKFFRGGYYLLLLHYCHCKGFSNKLAWIKKHYFACKNTSLLGIFEEISKKYAFYVMKDYITTINVTIKKYVQVSKTTNFFGKIGSYF